jgi:hypothetical protein
MYAKLEINSDVVETNSDVVHNADDTNADYTNTNTNADYTNTNSTALEIKAETNVDNADDALEIKIEPNVNSCPICLCDLIDDIKETKTCRHKFHRECITTWLENNNTCPSCRMIIKRNRGLWPDSCDLQARDNFKLSLCIDIVLIAVTVPIGTSAPMTTNIAFLYWFVTCYTIILVLFNQYVSSIEELFTTLMMRAEHCQFRRFMSIFLWLSSMVGFLLCVTLYKEYREDTSQNDAQRIIILVLGYLQIAAVWLSFILVTILYILHRIIKFILSYITHYLNSSDNVLVSV